MDFNFFVLKISNSLLLGQIQAFTSSTKELHGYVLLSSLITSCSGGNIRTRDVVVCEPESDHCAVSKT